jgi:hypothetical protein
MAAKLKIEKRGDEILMTDDGRKVMTIAHLA